MNGADMSEIKVAVIGLGKVAKVHLEAYRELADVRIVAGADPEPAQRAWAKADFGISVYADGEEMIARERPDLVCVLSPARFHRDGALAAINAGCHVLCEKPLALSLADAGAMKDAAQAKGVKFFYGASYRFLPALMKARDLISQGAIGRVGLMTEDVIGGAGAAARKEMGAAHYPVGGPGGSGSGLVDHGIHIIDAFSWLLAEPVTSVYGQGNISGAPSVPEQAALYFPSGALGRLTYLDTTFGTQLPADGAFSMGGSWAPGRYVPPGAWLPAPGQIFVYGDGGALRIQHYANYLYLFTAQGAQSVPLSGNSTPDNFARQLRQVVADIATGAPETVGIDVGIHALEVLLAIYASQRERRVVEVNSGLGRPK